MCAYYICMGPTEGGDAFLEIVPEQVGGRTGNLRKEALPCPAS